MNAGVVGFDLSELLVDGGDVVGVLGNGVGPAVEGGVMGGAGEPEEVL